jgi:hypothetical protein
MDIQTMWRYSAILVLCFMTQPDDAGTDQFRSTVAASIAVDAYRLQDRQDGKAKEGPGVIGGRRIQDGPVRIDPIISKQLVTAFSRYEPASWPPVVFKWECNCRPKMALRFIGESNVAEVILAIEFDRVEFYLDNQRLGTGALGELSVDIAEIAGSCFYDDSVMVSIQKSFGDTTKCVWTTLKRHDVEVLRVEHRLDGWKTDLGLLGGQTEAQAKAIALEAIESILRCVSSSASDTNVLVSTRAHRDGESLGFAKIYPIDRSLLWVGKSSRVKYPSN